MLIMCLTMICGLISHGFLYNYISIWNITKINNYGTICVFFMETGINHLSISQISGSGGVNAMWAGCHFNL